MVHYADAMRTRRRIFIFLVAFLVGYLIWVWLGHKGPWTIALGWVAVIAVLILGNAIMSCPACNSRMRSLFEKICSQCGAVLTDDAVMPPSTSGPADPRAAAYMAESRRILERWHGIRRKLGRAVPWLGLVVALGVFVVGWRSGPDHHTDAVVIAVFCWPVFSGVYWLILVYGLDNLFAVGFQIMRGRCPLCRAWMNLPSTVGLEAVHIELVLPNFCPSCSAKLS